MIRSSLFWIDLLQTKSQQYYRQLQKQVGSHCNRECKQRLQLTFRRILNHHRRDQDEHAQSNGNESRHSTGECKLNLAL